MDILIPIAMAIGTVAAGVSVTMLIGTFVPEKIFLSAEKHGRYSLIDRLEEDNA
ncbi:hypothetical protein [Cupriavidus sp. L7L]|uniref:hypothetical protein n=1 Tax=Cupriavidus sp. L7L TaxID=2546443 RepID=UPI0014055506|nr:hypothetical protein [Cupriavidus sp. L7L]